jgi:predicted RNase H-like HicB family nuclease
MKREASRNSYGAEGGLICVKVAQTCFFGYHKLRKWRIEFMKRQYTLEYSLDDGWCVGRLKEVPGVFSQGESLKELEGNIRDAYKMMMEDQAGIPFTGVKTKEIGVEV